MAPEKEEDIVHTLVKTGRSMRETARFISITPIKLSYRLSLYARTRETIPLVYLLSKGIAE